jgi:hypothetical protein
MTSLNDCLRENLARGSYITIHPEAHGATCCTVFLPQQYEPQARETHQNLSQALIAACSIVYGVEGELPKLLGMEVWLSNGPKNKVCFLLKQTHLTPTIQLIHYTTVAEEMQGTGFLERQGPVLRWKGLNPVTLLEAASKTIEQRGVATIKKRADAKLMEEFLRYNSVTVNSRGQAAIYGDFILRQS